MHDNMCGSRSLICGKREDEDLVRLLEEFDRRPKITQDEKNLVVEVCHDLINRAMRNEDTNSLGCHESARYDRRKEAVIRKLLEGS